MPLFRVIDAMDAPHGGRILRLRLFEGDTPSVRSLKGATLEARSADGEQKQRLEVEGLAVFGGKVSDARFKKTGRVDVHVRSLEGESTEMPGSTWEVEGPLG